MIPAFRPMLPTAEELLPWLQRIDHTRIYSNYGPLVIELENRLCQCLGLQTGQLVTASSGTAALVGGVLATAGRATAARPYALCPAYTFIGTASALQQCGYTPWFADVDAETWQLDPEALLDHPRLNEIGVVMPVAPYGRPVPLAAWERFRQRTGIAVVVDGAAAIEALLRDPAQYTGTIPVALSFHATKSFATGEGGALITTDSAIANAVFQSLNFGFLQSRESRTPSINGKMSEYHAAVGLASLARWDGYRQALMNVSEAYRTGLREHDIDLPFHGCPDVASNYALLNCPSRTVAASIAQALRDADIETRFWYGHGVHAQPVFSSHDARDPAPVTDMLASQLLGLPMAADMDTATICTIVNTVKMHSQISALAAW